MMKQGLKFFQRHSLIFPAGSLHELISSETPSIGKVITWPGPALAMLFFSE
jgi:hypothetical protein